MLHRLLELLDSTGVCDAHGRNFLFFAFLVLRFTVQDEPFGILLVQLAIHGLAKMRVCPVLSSELVLSVLENVELIVYHRRDIVSKLLDELFHHEGDVLVLPYLHLADEHRWVYASDVRDLLLALRA